MLFNRKLTQEKYLELLANTDLKKTNWLAIAKNQTKKDAFIHEVSINLEGEEQLSLTYLKKENECEINCSVNKFKNKFGLFSDEANFAQKNTDLFIHELLDLYIKRYINLLKTSDEKLATDPAGEQKGHEWLRVSFEVLKRAIDHAKSEDDLLFDPVLFMGQRPGTNEEVLRLLCYNLDINYQFLSDGTIHVRVYDDKNKEREENKKPSFHAVFIGMKNQVFDEMIKLLSTVGRGLEHRS